MKLILEGLYDFAEILYFFTLYYFFYAFTVQHFLPLIFHHGLNKDSQLWSNIETHNFFKEIKLHNFRHGLTLQLPDKYFSMFYLINNNFGMYQCTLWRRNAYFKNYMYYNLYRYFFNITRSTHVPNLNHLSSFSALRTIVYLFTFRYVPKNLEEHRSYRQRLF